MSKVDLSKKPEGATHWGPAVKHLIDAWFKFDGEHYHIWQSNGWNAMKHGVQPLRIETLIELQAKPVWVGVGLPSVGTVVEFIKHNSPPAPEGQWIKGDIRYISDCTVIIGGEGCEHVHHPRNVSFRPVRTPEQISADERLHEIRNALTTINRKVHFPNDLVRGNILAAAVEAMIDAGYRKQVKL